MNYDRGTSHAIPSSSISSFFLSSTLKYMAGDLEKQSGPSEKTNADASQVDRLPSSQKRSRRRNCCCRFLILLLKVVTAVAVLIGLTFASFFAVVNPQKMKVIVADARLRQFNLTGNQTSFEINLDLELAIRNPNRITGFYYDHFGVWVYYGGQYVQYGSLDDFYQGHKNTSLQKLSFKGNQTVYLDDISKRPVVSAFERERSAGVFSFDLQFEVWVRVKLGQIRIGTFVPKLLCPLEIPLIHKAKSAASSAVFRATKCKVKFKAISILDMPFENCLTCY